MNIHLRAAHSGCNRRHVIVCKVRSHVHSLPSVLQVLTPIRCHKKRIFTLLQHSQPGYFVDQNDDNEPLPLSRSARKRDAEGLQKLGEQLVELSAAQLQDIPLSPELVDAVRLAQRIGERGGRRRQLQLIGKLMRQEDPEPIREALARLEHRSAAAIAEHHQAERWRERLLTEGDTALSEFVAQYPAVDRQQLRQLVRTAKQEQAGGKPPRSTRVLFRLVRSLLSGS